jgi:integrase
VKKSFKGACRRVGIKNLRFHDLRHTFATRLVAKGIDIVSIKSLLGHSSVKVTERYTHSYIEQKRRAIEILGQDQSQNVPKPLNLLPICDMEEDSKNPRPKSSLFTTN